MSSGACRALAAVLLTLVATIGVTVPGAAEEERLRESTITTYTVNPNSGDIDVDILVVLESVNNRPVAPGTWGGKIVIDERARPVVSQGYEIVDRTSLPGPWEAIEVSHPRIPVGEQESFTVKYTLRAGTDRNPDQLELTGARVDQGYVYLCVQGQDGDVGSTNIIIKPRGRFEVDQSGTVLSQSNQGDLQSDLSNDPTDLFTCIEGTRDGRLEPPQEFPGPDDRRIVLQAWPGLSGWLFAAEPNSSAALDAIRTFLDIEIPGEAPVVIRAAPPRSIGGYASDHDTPGIVQLDENGGVTDPEHEMAHAWFGTDNIQELWLREGLAEWTATSIREETCPAIEGNASGVQLADWKVVQPTSDPDTIEQQIIDQELAACGIVSAMASRMSEERWREVLSSMLRGETKYIGSSGPGTASTTTVDYREWLDAVDERGLVPAGQSDPAYAANLENLDFAQNLLEEFGVDIEPDLLQRRSEARADYHRFLAEAVPLGAPLAVREAMDDWEFRRATEALAKSREVLGALKEADALLPTAGLIPFVQPAFESARTEAELDDVLEQTLTLLDSAAEIFEPLSELQIASPDGWNLPTAINGAITGQRFDEIMSAIPPSLSIVQDLSSANQFLPQAGVLDTYKARYEATATTPKLEELAEEVDRVAQDAERTAAALSELLASAGEWQIPPAVTDPLDIGQISAGFAIINDARAVVRAANDADKALPDAQLSSEIRPLFEAVATGGEMQTLRTQAELQRDQARAIGGALTALRTQAPDWQLPAVVDTPIRERRFAEAAEAAAIAQSWIDNAYEANTKLPAMNALDQAKLEFESAESLADLETGAARAESWNLTADRVALAQAAFLEPTDLMADLGLWGTDLKPVLDSAVAAAIDGDTQTAFNRAAAVIDTLNGASSDGALRLAGIIFLGVAIVGVLGLWLMLRREAGPPWARQTKPHWVDDKKGPGLLGRGKKSDQKKATKRK